MTTTGADKHVNAALLFDSKEWERKAVKMTGAASVFEGCVYKYWAADSEHKGEFVPCVSTHFMLMGFAIENILKAIIVEKHADDHKSRGKHGGALSKMLQTSDLTVLFDKAGLRTSGAPLLEILSRLSRSIAWEGRYPAPLPSHTGRKAHGSAAAQKSPANRAFLESDMELLTTTFESLCDILNKARLHITEKSRGKS